MSIKAGDKVKLKSGGPLMTVSSVYDTNVTCNWFDKTEIKTYTFELATLEIFTPRPTQENTENWGAQF